LPFLRWAALPAVWLWASCPLLKPAGRNTPDLLCRLVDLVGSNMPLKHPTG
jgi:hypothetical protein